MKTFFVLALALCAAGTLHASAADRFVAKVKLPSGQVVVVADGDFEARSIGRFSVRLYDAAAPDDETTFYRAGLVRERDGTVEKVVVAEVTGDSQPEIIVIVRSAGSGGYLSAHAFSFGKQRLAFVAGVDGLAAGADPMVALRARIRSQRSR